MEGLACTSCYQSTEKCGATVVLTRRIKMRSHDDGEEIYSADAVSQICPHCQIVGKTQFLEIGCMAPPLLEIEAVTIRRYIRKASDTEQLPPICSLPSCCTLCQAPIPMGTAFVHSEISTDKYIWRWTKVQDSLDLLATPKEVPHLLQIDSTERMVRSRDVEHRNTVPVLSACGDCTDAIWNLKLADGIYSTLPPCSTPGCPYCATLRASRVESS